MNEAYSGFRNRCKISESSQRLLVAALLGPVGRYRACPSSLLPSNFQVTFW